MASLVKDRHAKTKVVFVGPVGKPVMNQTTVAFQAACQSLLESPLSRYVEWRVIDSAVPYVPTPGTVRRGVLAFGRVVRLLALLILTRVDCLLVFGGYELTSFLEKGLMCLLGRLFRKRVVFGIRTEVRRCASDRWFLWFRRIAARSCDAILCQGEIPARLLVEILGVDPARTVPVKNWINFEAYRPSPTARRQRAAERPVRFLFVGRLYPGKGLDVLLQAASLLEKRALDFLLIICGDGSLLETLKTESVQLGLGERVEFRGWVAGDELMRAYWEADIYVLPTLTEGMPNAMLEAMAAGLPVIVTPISSIPCVVTEGRNGLYAQPGDPISLAEAMATLAKDLPAARKMGQTNLEDIAREHTIAAVWPRIATCLNVHRDARSTLESR